jgi:hypothetical protein
MPIFPREIVLVNCGVDFRKGRKGTKKLCGDQKQREPARKNIFPQTPIGRIAGVAELTNGKIGASTRCHGIDQTAGARWPSAPKKLCGRCMAFGRSLIDLDAKSGTSASPKNRICRKCQTYHRHNQSAYAAPPRRSSRLLRFAKSTKMPSASLAGTK